MNKIPMIGALAASAVFSVHSAEMTPYIVNGTDTSTSVYPSFSSIYTYANFDDGTYLYGKRCGATILDASYILTAAHCVSNQDTDEFNRLFTIVLPQLDDEASFDTSAEIAATTKYWVSDIYVHSGYNDQEFENDIAILKLETPLSVPSSAYAQFVANESQYRGESGDVFSAVGHGRTTTYSDDTTVLQEANLSLVNNADCGYGGTAPATQLCMEGEVVNSLEKATCSGDSGGPLYWTSGTQYQVGITSYGPSTSYGGCGSTSVNAATSVFTEVVDYASWIDDIKNGITTNATVYSPSETQRNYYRQNYTVSNDVLVQQTTTSSSSSSGGSVPLWASVFLLGAASIRRYKK